MNTVRVYALVFMLGMIFITGMMLVSAAGFEADANMQPGPPTPISYCIGGTMYATGCQCPPSTVLLLGACVPTEDGVNPAICYGGDTALGFCICPPGQVIINEICYPENITYVPLPAAPTAVPPLPPLPPQTFGGFQYPVNGNTLYISPEYAIVLDVGK